MKKWTVLLPTIAMVYDEVIQRSVEVIADYHRVEQGVLTFRRQARGNDAFPQAVRVFAPGFWAEVIEGPEVTEPRVAVKHAKNDHMVRRLSQLDYAGAHSPYSDDDDVLAFRRQDGA